MIKLLTASYSTPNNTLSPTLPPPQTLTMQLLLLSFLLCVTICVTFSDAKRQKPPKTLRHSTVEGVTQIFGRSLMKGILPPSNDVGKKIMNRKKRRGLRNVVVVVVPPNITTQKK